MRWGVHCFVGANRAITRESDYFCERYAGEMNKAKWSSRPRLNLFSRFPVYLHGQKPSVLLKTFLAFCCVGLMFSVVAPVIADENAAPLPSATETTTVTSEATATPTPSPAPTPTPAANPYGYPQQPPIAPLAIRCAR